MSMWMWSKWPAARQIVRKPSSCSGAMIASITPASLNWSWLTSSAAELRHW